MIQAHTTRLFTSLAATLPVAGGSVEATERETTAICTWHDSSFGKVRVQWESQPTPEQLDKAAKIIKAHDPSPKLSDRITPDEARVLLSHLTEFSPDEQKQIKELAAQAESEIIKKAKGQA